MRYTTGPARVRLWLADHLGAGPCSRSAWFTPLLAGPAGVVLEKTIEYRQNGFTLTMRAERVTPERLPLERFHLPPDFDFLPFDPFGEPTSSF